MAEYREKFEEWKQNVDDGLVKASLAEMEGNEEEIESAFYKDLEFGTGGLRGIMSAGTDRMNIYTVKRATEGLAKYMLSQRLDSCAVTYDSRLNSELFAKTAASTLASFGITVYITKKCMPTPFLSFATRYYGCGAGINVTASHNPCEYNGYKVYDASGCQLTDEAANKVTWFIENCKFFESGIADFGEFVGKKIFYVDPCAEEAYIKSVLGESLCSANGIKIAYTPLNGVGYEIVPRVLEEAGVKKEDIFIVPEQSYPDGHFTTCPYPNPEKKEALSLAVKLAEEKGCDVVIATDPDSDRLGVAVLHNGKMRQLSGNEVGVLLCDFILRERNAKGDLPENPVVVKTIVSTMLINAIAAKYNAVVKDVLTGFKYIGDAINKLESAGRESDYVFGFEESCGYLKGSYVRDKDGVVASMLFAECAASLKKQGKTLVDRLNETEKEFGAYSQLTVSYRFDGVSGAEKKKELLCALRTAPLKTLGGSEITDSCDFLSQTEFDLPRADVLRYNSADGSQLIIRPSGTEPLIKCYMFARGLQEDNEKRIDAMHKQLDALFA